MVFSDEPGSIKLASDIAMISLTAVAFRRSEAPRVRQTYRAFGIQGVPICQRDRANNPVTGLETDLPGCTSYSLNSDI
jgi:hypothetical protein